MSTALDVTVAGTEFAPPLTDRPAPDEPAFGQALLANLDHDDRRAGRGAVIGGTIGFVMMAVGAFVLGVANDLGIASSIGVGLFCGFWGGLGFGAMLGATIWLLTGHEREGAAAPSPARSPDE